MYSVISLATIAFAAFASVDAAVVPRTNKPDTYLEGYLESYEVYHTRYLAIDCHLKHGTEFFDDCCHPMLATESLEKNRKAYCVPSPAASSSAHAAEPTSTITTPVDPNEDCDDEEENDDDFEDCDDEEDSPVSTPEPQPTPSPSLAPLPVPDPAPISSKAPLPQSTVEVKSTASPEPKPESKPEPTPKQEPTPKAEPTPESKPEPERSTTKAPEPAPTKDNGGSIVGGVVDIIKGGFATFFYQNGVAGACGTVHSDNDLIAAMDSRRYGNTGVRSPLCGEKVTVTNVRNNKSVVVTIADACPTCENSNSIDLSYAAFTQIAPPGDGIVEITWHKHS